MSHEKCAGRLDDYVDGALPSADRAELEAHLATCAVCTASVARLRVLLQAARQLPASLPPARDLWPDLRERLVGAGATLPGAGPAGDALHSHRGPRSAASNWAAAAMLALLTTSVWLAQRHDLRSPRDQQARGPQATVVPAPALAATGSGVTEAVVVAFERECMGAGKALLASVEGRSVPADEAMLRTVASGIEVLDQSIAETLAALASHVDDAALMKLLTVRYQQKLALLQGAIAIVEEV